MNGVNRPLIKPQRRLVSLQCVPPLHNIGPPSLSFLLQSVFDALFVFIFLYIDITMVEGYVHVLLIIVVKISIFGRQRRITSKVTIRAGIKARLVI